MNLSIRLFAIILFALIGLTVTTLAASHVALEAGPGGCCPIVLGVPVAIP